MGGRVAPLAVGETGIIVLEPVLVGDELAQHRDQILDQRALELVDEERAGRVQGVHEQKSLPDVDLPDDVANLLRQVHDLHVLFAAHGHRLPVHPHDGQMRLPTRVDVSPEHCMPRRQPGRRMLALCDRIGHANGPRGPECRIRARRPGGKEGSTCVNW